MKEKRSHPPTARDVARVAGVTATTVSYVLSGRSNGKDRISAETRQRILDAVKVLGYVPNATARSLRKQRTDRICLLLPRVGVPYYDVLSQDLRSAAEDNGYTFIISLGGSREVEYRALDQMRRGLADALVVEPHVLSSVDTVSLESLAEAGIAVVAISNDITGKGFDVVRTTEREAAYTAVEYLITQDHRRIAFLNHGPDYSYRYERFNSYLQALVDHGLPVDESLIRGGAQTREDAYQSVHQLLRLLDRPTAIFSASDIAAVSALNAAHDLGLHVPQDIAIIGVGNIPESEITSPPLTTIGPLKRGFKEVTQLLFSRLQSETPLEGRLLLQPWQLIHRDSA
jgi:DNA-binding LacI/PurR family transcriptional regulator